MKLTRRNALGSALACVLPLLMAGRAEAQVAQSFDELVTRRLLFPGEKVDVRDSSGRDTAGVVSEVKPGSLVLVGPEGRIERTFTESEVQRIRRAGGHAIGWSAILGGSLAFLATFAAARTYGENEGGGLCTVCLVQWAAVAVPLGAGIGAGAGFGIEQARRETVYLGPRTRRSVSAMPWLLPGSAGALVSVRF